MLLNTYTIYYLIIHHVDNNETLPCKKTVKSTLHKWQLNIVEVLWMQQLVDPCQQFFPPDQAEAY